MTDPAAFLKQAQDLGETLSGWRRQLHRRPELGLECVEASDLVVRELRDLGLDVRSGLARTGVVGVLRGGPGPVAALRVDMDALPLEEMTGLAFASEIPGRMHACGHDGHTALGLGVARLLAAQRDELHGSVAFVFQPGEEYPGGARPMLAEGALADPTPDMILGCHLAPGLPLGRFGVCRGPATAGNEEFTITLTGRGGHAARPQACRNPIAAAARLIPELQSPPSVPGGQLVISVTECCAGSGHNVIPDKAVLRGTIRFLDNTARGLALQHIGRLLRDLCLETGVQSCLEHRQDGPPMILPAGLAARVRAWAAEIAGSDGVTLLTEPSMGAEDFAYFAEAFPAAYLRLGCGEPGREHDLHTPCFDFDESALPAAAAVLSWCLLGFLRD